MQLRHLDNTYLVVPRSCRMHATSDVHAELVDEARFHVHVHVVVHLELVLEKCVRCASARDALFGGDGLQSQQAQL